MKVSEGSRAEQKSKPGFWNEGDGAALANQQNIGLFITRGFAKSLVFVSGSGRAVHFRVGFSWVAVLVERERGRFCLASVDLANLSVFRRLLQHVRV